MAEYNENEDLVLGESLMMYVDKEGEMLPIAYATSHNLTVNGDTIDTSSKMSGTWKSALVGQLEWALSVDALISKTEGQLSFNTLLEMMRARKGVKVQIGTPKDTTDFALDKDKPIIEGMAIFTSLEQTASRNEVCTSTCNLQGQGELKISGSSSDSPSTTA